MSFRTIAVLRGMSGWPSGLRRCVQVAVSPGGVGSNPTSDNTFLFACDFMKPQAPSDVIQSIFEASSYVMLMNH